jgi:hypothetical protein
MAKLDKLSAEVLEELLTVRRTLLFNVATGKAVQFTGNVNWEELTCVGYNPQTSTLQAVVAIKRSAGYSGGLCFPGSKEFVRFFIDYGSGFQDLGYTSFDVHDIPDSPAGAHPIEYIVQMQLPDAKHRRCCGTPALPKVRAVLSWNTPPGANPNVLNSFGNMLDAHIQLAPKPFSLACLIESGVLNGGLKVLKQFDVEKALSPLPLPPAPDFSELAQKYKNEKVQPHRFLTPLLHALTAKQAAAYPIFTNSLQSFSKQGIDLAAELQLLEKTSADVTYEQLTCAGLQTATDTVGAIIHIKKPLGYNGDLCHPGSKEYVAFWADWHNNGTFNYLGTASVDVHDLESAPSDGVRYSVSLPALGIVEHLRACGSPNVIRLRAVLSWSTPPSTTDPNALNTWGNRLDVHVQIRPGTPVTQGELTDLIFRVGGVQLSDISTVTHLANPSTVISGLCGTGLMDQPWGGQVTIKGRIYNTGAPGSVRFRIRYKKHSDPDAEPNWTPVTFSQGFILVDPSLPYPSELSVSQTAGSEPGLGGGWFDYIENPLASPPVFEMDNRLADWSTGSLEGDFDLRLEYRKTTDAPNFYHRSHVVSIKLHNYQMKASIVAAPIIDFTQDLDLVIDGGDCHSYSQSTTIHGHLRVADPYFGNWKLDLQPATHTNGTNAAPSCRTYSSLTDTGDDNTAWTLDTSKLDKCGYTLTLVGSDRTIVNNGASTHTASKAVGFSVV